MAKVHASQLFKAIHDTPTGTRLVTFRRVRRFVQEPLVIDGPFAESKESCSHVVLLTRHAKAVEPQPPES
jgi:hypothetical protein